MVRSSRARRRWSLSPLVLSAAIALVAVSVVVPARSRHAGAQVVTSSTAASATPAITIVSVTNWVAADGVWTAGFRVSNAPLDAMISYSLHQRVSGNEPSIRTQLAALRTATPTGRVLARSTPTPLLLATDPTGMTTVRIPISSTTGAGNQVLLTAPGSYPIVLTVSTVGNQPLASRVLAVNRLAVPTKAPRPPMKLAVLLDQLNGDGYDRRGRPQVPPSGSLDAQRLASLLSAAPQLAFTVCAQPEMISALDASANAADQASIGSIRTAIGTRTVLRRPWAPTHLEAWARQGAGDAVRSMLLDGEHAVVDHLKVPTENRLWSPDPTMGARGVQLLGGLGVNALLVEPTQVTGSKPPAGESGFSRPFRINGGGSTSMRAFSLDPMLQALLGPTTPSDSTEQPTEPVVAAHQLLTQLFAVGLSGTGQRGAVVSINASSDPVASTALVAALSAAFPSGSSAAVEVVDARSLVEDIEPITVTRRNAKVPFTRELVEPTDVPDVHQVVSLRSSVQPLVADYAAVMTSAGQQADELGVRFRSSTSSSRRPDEQAAELRAIERLVVDTFGRITAPEPRSLTVTARQTSIPIRFDNGLTTAVTVRLRVASPRLKFLDGGDRQLELAPGTNRFNIRVQVRSSGEFVLKTSVQVPGSPRTLASTRYRIRSTAFSGVGLMLSGGALLFLVLWWSRTLRAESESESDDPDSDDGPDGDGRGPEDRLVSTAPTEPESIT